MQGGVRQKTTRFSSVERYGTHANYELALFAQNSPLLAGGKALAWWPILIGHHKVECTSSDGGPPLGVAERRNLLKILLGLPRVELDHFTPSVIVGWK